MEGKRLRQITHQNDALMNELEPGQTEEVNFKSKDGTEVHGLLTYPVNYVKGTKVPLLLRIHGGPNGQDQHSFSVERQVFAANGYAVIAVNYRGSSGRGQKFSRAIFADWGHYEVEDLLAGVDQVLAMLNGRPHALGPRDEVLAKLFNPPAASPPSCSRAPERPGARRSGIGL